MIRALSLTCAALLVVGWTGSVAFAGKPSIAVLGLEVIDQNGTPTAADTQVAKELSDGLRARAKAGTGPYQLAPGSDKELIDQKLLNNCDNEAAACMSAIGGQLGAEILMYGRIEKQSKAYQVTLKVLDVGKKQVLKSSSDMIPLADANGASLQGWAKKMYGKLTGESSASTLVVKLANADRGTILIDGEPKGTITNGSGQVALSEGKYRVTVESQGFRRWEKEVSLSGTQTVPVELEPTSGGDSGSGVIGAGPGFGPGPGPGPEGGGKGKLGWKIGAGVGAVVMVGGLYFAYDSWQSANSISDEQRAHCVFPDGENDPACTTSEPWTPQQVADSNDQGGKYARNANIGWGIAAAGAVIGGFSLYKVLTSDGNSSRERQSVRGKRQRKDRTFVVTPIVLPKSGGATLRIDW